jgi:hypothetical protein
VLSSIGSHVRANAVGYVALFFALAGSAVAVSSVEKDSVGSRALKRDAVKSRHVDDGKLKGKDIKDGTVESRDIDPDTLADLEGPAGPPGAAGATNVITRRADVIGVSGAGGTASTSVTCDPGEVATGGGAAFNAASTTYRIALSEPLEADMSLPEPGDVAVGWLAAGVNNSGATRNFYAYVICASP